MDDADPDLERFVERFGASHTFIRERPHAHTREEATYLVFPTALKRFRAEVVATVDRPNRRMTVQFDGYDFPLSDRTRDRWYEIGLLGYYNNSIRAVMDDWAHLYPIGYADGDAQTSGFGMPVSGDDGRVFRILRA